MAVRTVWTGDAPAQVPHYYGTYSEIVAVTGPEGAIGHPTDSIEVLEYEGGRWGTQGATSKAPGSLTNPFPSTDARNTYYASQLPGAVGWPVFVSPGVEYRWLGGLSASTDADWELIPMHSGIASGLPVFFSLGDSISNDGGYRWNDSAVPDPNIYRYCWQWYAQAASKSAMRFGGAFGQAGYTIEQIVSTWLPSLLAKASKGDYVFVLMGQNNLGGEVAGTLATYTSAIRQIENAGLIPILCTLTPGAATAWFHKLNSHIRNLASGRGRFLCDFHATVTATDGTWIDTLRREVSGGEVHPNELGAWTMGQTAAEVITKLAPTPSWSTWLPRSEAGFTQLRAGGGSCPSQLFLTDNGATPPLPTGWSAPAAPVVGAIGFSSVAGIPGRTMTLTKVAGNYPIIRTSFCNDGIYAGDDFIFAFRVTSNIKATGTTWFFGVMNNVGTPYYDRGRVNTHFIEEDQTDDIVVVRFKAPANAPGGLIDFGLNGGNGGTVKISQIQILNLTALGLA